MAQNPATGTVHRINVSDGGVPKTSVESAEVLPDGLTTDRQAHPRFHGGPERAVCLLGLDAIGRLQAEGHPIQPGTTGENLTIAGLDWTTVVPGTRFAFEGGVELEVLSYAVPCGSIRASFLDGAVERMAHETHAGESRVYTRVLAAGSLRQGEACAVYAPATQE